MTPVHLRVKELRTARGWSQRELARRSGVRQATLSQIESRVRAAINLADLERLANALEVDAGYLVVHDTAPRPKRSR